MKTQSTNFLFIIAFSLLLAITLHATNESGTPKKPPILSRLDKLEERVKQQENEMIERVKALEEENKSLKKQLSNLDRTLRELAGCFTHTDKNITFKKRVILNNGVDAYSEDNKKLIFKTTGNFLKLNYLTDTFKGSKTLHVTSGGNIQAK